MKLYDHRGYAHLRGESPPLKLDHLDTDACFLLQIALHFHFGIVVPDEGTKPLLIRGAVFAKEYFFGEWRLERDDSPAELRQELTWIPGLKVGWMSALLVDDMATVSHLATYPEVDCLQDDWEFPKAYQLYWIVLGYEVLGKEKDAMETVLPKRMGRFTKLLINCLWPLHARDSVAFGAALKKYLDGYLAAETEWFIDRVVSIDASILYNLARLRGMELPELDQAYGDVLVTPESMGIDCQHERSA